MRTQYVIKLNDSGRYFVARDETLHYGFLRVESWMPTLMLAQRFEFMTTATHYALTTLGLGGHEFTVEPV